MIRGIDVSHYQGHLNWTALKTQYHLSFAGAKCSEGASLTDAAFSANWAGMASAGLVRIAYHYARPEQSSAASQAARFVALAKPRARLDCLCLDLEASNLSQAATNAWMKAFGDALRRLAPNVTTIAYLGGYAANGSGRSAVSHFDYWWYPHYASMSLAKSWPVAYEPNVAGNTTGWKSPPAPHLWQWTPNLAGRDGDLADLTVEQLRDPHPAIPPKPFPIPLTEDDDMMILVREQTPSGSPVWLSVNNMHRRLVANEADLASIISTMKDNKTDPWFQEIHRIPNGDLPHFGIDISPTS